MDYAIKKLKQDEIVLMKKIKGLQDGKPKWAAAKQLDEIRAAITLLDKYNNITAEDMDNLIDDYYTQYPPHAKA